MTHALHGPVSALMGYVAQEIILPRFRMLADDEREEKTPGDFVTIADRESEALLTERLAALLPGSRVLGEEAEAADPGAMRDLASGALWVVDPLDGTNNFAEGITPFAVMIALVQDGVTQAGWILDPVSGRMCHAARGEGTLVDGARVTARPSGGVLPKAALAMHFLSPERRADIERRALGRLDLVAIPRCAGEQYPRLFLGANDIALFERANPWDHLPGALMLEEAGGRIARPGGRPYRIDEPGPGLIAAASPALWDVARDVLFG